MSLAGALETTRIHRVAGRTGARTAVVTTRPFRAPHHTISDVGLVGGGQMPLPGAGSLAYHGILFLDERSEFRRHVLEVLSQPLEGHIAQYLGDRLLVCFGYPRAHEEDAQRAVRVSPGILEGMDTLNTRLERGEGLRSQGNSMPFFMRVSTPAYLLSREEGSCIRY
jgi:hypothetical protein